MDFWGTVRLLIRRWYVVAPALVLSVVLTLLTYSSIPTRYSSSGSLLLTSPASGAKFSELTDPSEVAQVNPLLAFDGSLVISAQIASQVLNNPATQKELGAGGDSPSTYLANNGESNGPIVFVMAESDSAAESEAVVARALDRARQELDNRQRELNAPPSTFINAQVLVAPTEAAPQIGGKIRFAGAAMVVSLLMTLGAAFAVDSIAAAMKRQRDGRQRKRRRTAPPGPPQAGPPQANSPQPGPPQGGPPRPGPLQANSPQPGSPQDGSPHPGSLQAGTRQAGPPQQVPRSPQAGLPGQVGSAFRSAPLPGTGGRHA